MKRKLFTAAVRAAADFSLSHAALLSSRAVISPALLLSVLEKIPILPILVALDDMHLQQTKDASLATGGPQYYFHTVPEPVKEFLRKRGVCSVVLQTPYGIASSAFTAVGRDHKLSKMRKAVAGKVGHDRFRATSPLARLSGIGTASKAEGTSSESMWKRSFIPTGTLSSSQPP